MKRIKRRYLNLKIDTDAAIEEREFMDAVWAALYKLYGEFGASQASLALISFDSAEKHAVLRANLNVVDNVRAALASIIAVSGKAAAVHVLAVSGTIKSLRE